MNADKTPIRSRALALIEADGHRVGARLAQAAGVSRQVANGYLQAMVRDGLVSAEGTTRARVYALRALEQARRRYPREGLQED
ncbi:MAG: ArsR family transcriptional regulator, partial [Betaproteobacteria bacterium]